MPFIVIRSDGSTSEPYETYYPAEQEAKSLNYASIVYQGVRGMEVKVYPL